jgi:hypothetical protein
MSSLEGFKEDCYNNNIAFCPARDENQKVQEKHKKGTRQTIELGVDRKRNKESLLYILTKGAMQEN